MYAGMYVCMYPCSYVYIYMYVCTTYVRYHSKVTLHLLARFHRVSRTTRLSVEYTVVTRHSIAVN